MSKPDYKEAVKQAETAVASIKDGDLKAIAFGKILDTLLVEGGGSEGKDTPSKRRREIRQAAGPKPPKKKGGPKAYLENLVEEGFFKTPKTLTAVRAELGNRGHHIPVTSLSRPRF